MLISHFDVHLEPSFFAYAVGRLTSEPVTVLKYQGPDSVLVRACGQGCEQSGLPDAARGDDQYPRINLQVIPDRFEPFGLMATKGELVRWCGAFKVDLDLGISKINVGLNHNERLNRMGFASSGR